MDVVFIETNWVVGVAAPNHLRIPAAETLLTRARNGNLRLFLPHICLAEARRTIPRKFTPRAQADNIREFLRYARTAGSISEGDFNTTLSVISRFENQVRGYLHNINMEIDHIRHDRAIEVFALNEDMLIQAVEIGASTLDLEPIDQAILAAVLVKSRELRTQGITTISFCELDGDLQPWDRNGNRKPQLEELYNRERIWVFNDFDLSTPSRPPGW